MSSNGGNGEMEGAMPLGGLDLLSLLQGAAGSGHSAPLDATSGDVEIPFRLLPDGAEFQIGDTTARRIGTSGVEIEWPEDTLAVDVQIDTPVIAHIKTASDCTFLVGGAEGVPGANVKRVCDRTMSCIAALPLEKLYQFYISEIVLEATAEVGVRARDRLVGKELGAPPAPEAVLNMMNIDAAVDALLSVDS